MTRNFTLSSVNDSTFNTITNTRRRSRSSPRNSSDNNAEESNTLPSRIPIKSPARPSASNVGGMAIAYSPRSESLSSDRSEIFNDLAYAKKLTELRNAMEMLKTPPSVKINNLNSNSSVIINDSYYSNNNSNINSINKSNTNTISYTPIKSSGLATADFITDSSFNDSIDYRRQSSSSLLNLADDENDNGPDYNLNLNISYTEPVSMEMLSVSENDTSLLDAYNDNDEYECDNKNAHGKSLGSNKKISNSNSMNFSCSSPNRSSPYISSDELRHRLQATREAFQKSLEAQKRTSQIRQQQHSGEINFKRPLDLDSCFSTCGDEFDSDLSTDTLRDTRKLLERIKREAGDLIESDLEEVSKNNSFSGSNRSSPLKPIDYYYYSTVLYSIFFALTFVIFSFLFINYSPISAFLSLFKSLSSMNMNMIFDFSLYYNFKNYFRSDSFLEKFEEFLNLLLKED